MSNLLTSLRDSFVQEVVHDWPFLALGAVGLGFATTAFALLAVSRYSRLLEVQDKYIELQRQMIALLQGMLRAQTQVTEPQPQQEGRQSLRSTDALVATGRQYVLHAVTVRQLRQVPRLANLLLMIGNTPSAGGATLVGNTRVSGSESERLWRAFELSWQRRIAALALLSARLRNYRGDLQNDVVLPSRLDLLADVDRLSQADEGPARMAR